MVHVLNTVQKVKQIRKLQALTCMVEDRPSYMFGLMFVSLVYMQSISALVTWMAGIHLAIYHARNSYLECFENFN